MFASKTVFMVCLFGVVAIALAQPAKAPEETKRSCGKGEVYSDCGSSCPVTCESRGDTCKVCTQQCVEGCFCANGTIRAPNGSCVPPEQCPPRTCTGENEVFDECPPTCPPTEKCENLWNKKTCNELDCCTPQCRCKHGFYRNYQNKCITAQACMAKKGRKGSEGPEGPPPAEALHGSGKI